jgi:predicted dehydrogenase
MPGNDPRMAPALRWGILGAGFIAGKFINAVTRHTASKIEAIGSRDAGKAARLASAQGIDASHHSYEGLVSDPRVQAVYVATPHPFHLEHALLAIAAGKPVLIEKPMARNAKEAVLIAEAARSAGVFAMEAMWTRFLPHMTKLRDVVAKGELGQIVQMHAEHGQRFAFDPSHRVYDPDLAGGALLDLGVYPMSFIHDTLGEPTRVSAIGALTETGVDGNVSLVLGYEGKLQATLSTTLWALTGITASITGTEGRVSFGGPFLRPTSFTVHRPEGAYWTFDGEARNGFQYEIAEVARCVTEGRTESAILGLDDSIAVLRTLDEARRQVGVRYEGELAS